MKITVLRKNLRDGLSIIEHGITEHENLPILKHVLIKTVDDRIQLTATNLEIAITTIVSGKVVESGSIAVPFLAFYNIISNISTERIEIETSAQQLTLSTDNYSAAIQGLPDTDFPIIPVVSETQTLEVDIQLFRSALLQVVPAAQLSEIRPELGGVLFDFQLTVLQLVATDSFRLAQKTLTDHQFKSTITGALKAIVPLQTIQEIIRIFQQSGTVRLFFDAHQLLITSEVTKLVSRLIDGDYPHYEQVIPTSFLTTLHMEHSYLAQALKLVSSFSSKINDIHFKLGSDQKSLEVFASHQYVGENKFLIPVKTQGDSFSDLIFNWKYMLDGIRVIEGENLIFSLNGDQKPGSIHSQEDGSFLYVVMPIRL